MRVLWAFALGLSFLGFSSGDPETDGTRSQVRIQIPTVLFLKTPSGEMAPAFFLPAGEWSLKVVANGSWRLVVQDAPLGVGIRLPQGDKPQAPSPSAQYLFATRSSPQGTSPGELQAVLDPSGFFPVRGTLGGLVVATGKGPTQLVLFLPIPSRVVLVPENGDPGP